MLLRFSGSLGILPLLKEKKSEMGILEITIYHFQQKLEFTESFAGHFSPFSPF